MNFRINPSLPAGIVLDPHTGWISGTATSESATQTYTITATKMTGGDVTATISLSVSVCTGGKGLMTVRIRADGLPSENSWKLYEGRGTSGTVLRSVSEFPVSSAYYYVDFCLDNGIYTFEGSDSFGDGWQVGSGYTLTVDYGEMELDMNEVPNTGVKPVIVTTVFSTYFPFQIEYTDWKVIQSDDVSSNWNTVSFDDSTWNTYKAVDIPSTSSITTYIRKSFTMSGVNDYQVLNVRVKYSGGVAAYVNGNLVARFNLAEDFDSTSLSITDHDPNVFSKFHVILSTSGIQEGSNVFSFEIHRPLSGSSSDPVVFDATGVFGVEDCSTVVDSYSSLESTNPSSGTLDGIMDLDPYTTGYLPNTIGTYIEWTVENLEGSKWNSFNIVGGSTVTSWGFDIIANYNLDDTTNIQMTILSAIGQTVTERTKPQIAVPVALAGFHRYRWEMTVTGSTGTTLGSVHMAYCKASGSVCPGIGNYPSVGEGQISPSYCPEGYRGYSYRECSGGVLGEVKTDHCSKRPPMNASYRPSQNRFVMGTAVTTGVPSVRNIVDRWYIDTGVTLPNGLSLNAQTGEISGTPIAEQELVTYTVYAENESGATQATVSIQVRKGECMAEGVFPVTYVGETAVYECSSQGSYVGTQKR
ncbi:cadherin domain-containing protein, partial [Blastocystis sp. subtype 4]|uniref:cadherin domain-containing protein n=1 Tax=Blastocystis sp. subtype 4 TaxID=944170 RepID=UPI000711ECA9